MAIVRDPSRIPPFLAEVQDGWDKVPYLRFGQLMSNFFRQLPNDVFYYEDEVLIEEFKKYVKRLI